MEERPWTRFYDYNVPTTIRYPRIPIQNLFFISAAAYPDKAATNFYGTEVSFWQLKEQVLRLSNSLVKLGVKKGDRVGLQLPNCPQYPIAYLAILCAGGIVVNMNPLYTKEELKFIMENTTMESMITFDMVLPVVGPLAKEVGLKRLIVTKVTDYITGFGVSTAKDLDLGDGFYHFSDLISGCNDNRIPKIPFTYQDPAVIQFTGGTTGVPKGAVLTHANIIAATFQGALWGSPTVVMVPHAERTGFGVIPYFHVYGNIYGLNWSLFSCATQYLMPRFDLEEMMGLLEKIPKITYFPAVPTLITAIVNHPKAAAMDLGKKIGLISSGGAPMPVELIDKVRDLGISFTEGWGMSETASLGSSNPLMANKVGSIGVPMPDAIIRLVDLDNGTEDVKPGAPGEMIIKGPTVMQGYWNNPEETANQLKDGWLYTGDVAVADEDGYMFIVDRKKDMIIAGGFNIYPREVDEVLYQNPKIAEAVTVGVPDEYRGETVKAFIVVKPGEKMTEKEVVDFCKQKLTGYKVPKMVEFRDALPKSAVGKILRKILREEEIKKAKK